MEILIWGPLGLGFLSKFSVKAVGWKCPQAVASAILFSSLYRSCLVLGWQRQTRGRHALVTSQVLGTSKTACCSSF